MQMLTCNECGEDFERKHRRGRRPDVCGIECKRVVRNRQQKAWHKANPERSAELGRERSWRYNYNLEREDYKSLLAFQGGGCSICRTPPPDGRYLAVDHDHATGAIRGLLCTNCNTALGVMGDDPERLRHAIAYLANPPALVALDRVTLFPCLSSV